MIKDFDINCSYCSACISACPLDAIFLVTHKNGYLYPVINSKKCIGCNKRSFACQLFRKGDSKTNVSSKIIYSEPQSNQAESSSGGFCYNFAKYFLKQNGIVYSSFFDSSKRCVCMRRFEKSNLVDLSMIRGSKYAKSNLGSIFRDIKIDLQKGYQVCVIGMPCEIKGLYLFLSKDYKNLTSISLLCGGSVSTNYFSNYIDELSKKYKNPVMNINFRDKRYGPVGYLTSIHFESKVVYPMPAEDAYIKILSSEFIRPACKSCNFGPTNFASNMMVCDFHQNDKVGFKTLVLINHVSSFSTGIFSLMEKNIINITDSNSADYNVAYENVNKKKIIDEEMYVSFYRSLLTKGTYKTVNKYIYRKLSLKRRLFVRLPYFLRGIIYGNKK